MDTLLERAQVKIVEGGVKRFEMDKPTCLATYLCRTGLEFLLLQQDSVRRPDCGPGHWRLVLAGSRFLKEAETRYSMPEGEVLAIGLGMEQRKMLLLGCLLHGHRPPSLAPYLGGQGIGPN